MVVDPRVKGQITLVTENAGAAGGAFQQFQAALRPAGLHGGRIGQGCTKVVPEADAKLQTGAVSVTQGGSGGTPAGGQMVTQIFKLNFENANNLVPVLRP